MFVSNAALNYFTVIKAVNPSELTLKLGFCSVTDAAAVEASVAGSHAAVAACTTVRQPSSLGANRWLATHCMTGPARFQMLDLTAPGSTAQDCTP